MNHSLHNSLLKDCRNPSWKAVSTYTTPKPSKNGHSPLRGTKKYGLKNRLPEEASTRPSQKDNQVLTQKDNSIGGEETKEEDRGRGKPTAVEVKVNGAGITQDSSGLSIQMPWIQVPLHEKSTLRKRNSAIEKKDDALNVRKLDTSHDSALTENPTPKL